MKTPECEGKRDFEHYRIISPIYDAIKNHSIDVCFITHTQTIDIGWLVSLLCLFKALPLSSLFI